MTRMMLAFSTTAMIAVIAGDAAGQGLQQPDSVRPVNFDYFAQPEAEESPSDKAVEHAEHGEYGAEESCTDCGECGECDSRGCSGGLSGHLGHKLPCNKTCDEPWTLFAPPRHDNGIRIGGWVQAGATANADNPSSRSTSPLSFNDRSDVTLNQLNLFAEKTLSGDPYRWDWGGRVDLLFGTDARFTQAPGLEMNRDGSNKWNSQRFYALSLPQMYLEAGRGDFSVKVGRFYTPIGYEAVPSTANFFYSHSNTNIYGEPFIHTGFLADYKLNDQITVYGGATNGWDNFDAIRERWSFLGGVNWTSYDERTALAFSITSGQEANSQQDGFSNRSMYSIVFTRQLGENWEYVLQHDLGQQSNDGGSGVDAEWYGVNQYLFYTINDCWRAGTRIEWFRDDDGTRVDGSEGNFYEATLGLNWTPTANITVRPEVRWDWFEGDGSLPYDDGTKDNQFTAAFDVIFLF